MLSVNAALDGGVNGARRVVVVDRDGHMRALVVADALSSAGAEVEFITPLAQVGQQVDGMSLRELTAHLAGRGVRFSPGEDVARWEGKSLVLRDAFSAVERRVEGVAAVVIAGGAEPVNELSLALAGRVAELYVIGDANVPKTVEEATYQGGLVGRQI